MDKLKATMLLAEIKGYLTAGNPVWDVDEIAEACDMAIEALKMQSTDGISDRENAKYTCSTDLISRSDALAEFKDGRDVYDIMESIEEIPSATCDDCIWHVCNYNKIDWDGEDGYISKRDAIDAVLELNTDGRVSWQDAVIDMLDALPSADRPYQYSEAHVTRLRGERDLLQDMVSGLIRICMNEVKKNDK